IQLAMRTGMYKTINATHVYEGEIEHYNRITGEVRFSEDGPTSDKIVGYIAYFKLVNGFEKFEYWPVERVKEHAERFSQSYRSGRNSPWQTDFDAMATKTVLKSLLSKYGVLSIEMQTAVVADQAVIMKPLRATNTSMWTTTARSSMSRRWITARSQTSRPTASPTPPTCSRRRERSNGPAPAYGALAAGRAGACRGW